MATSDARDVVYRSARTQVHRCQRDGVPVLVKAALVDSPEARAAATHEAAVLELLRGLSVPTTFGLDERSRPPALVMLDEDYHGLPHGAPWTIDDFFEVAVPLARSLAEIHASGVVHCDINPSNIVRNPANGQLQFIDFDLAIAGSASERIEEPIGTLDYLAPEQTGRVEHPIDTRADLYGLGATFFELLVGRPPFQADDAVGLIHAHLTKAPDRVRDLRPDVPDVINLIVARLLEKEPDERYPSAEVLATDLETCLEHWERNGAIPLFELAATTSPQVKTPSEPVGVDDELGELMMAGDARLLAVTGAEGVGKTTMLNLAKTSFGPGATIFEPVSLGEPTGRPDGHEDEPVPYSYLSAALKSFAQEILTSSDEDLDRWRERLTTALGAELSTLVDLAPDLAPVVNIEPPSERPEGPTARVKALESLFLDLVWDTQPVLFFDDLDHADRESIEVLAELVVSPTLTGLGILCGATELPDRLGDVVDEHQDGDDVEICVIELHPLDQRGVTDLILHALGNTVRPAPELAALLIPSTGGIPGHVLAVLRSLDANGGLWTTPNGAWDWSPEALDALPRIDSIVELLIAQFALLDEQSRQVLGVAACLRTAFSIDDILAVPGSTAEPMDVALTLEASASIGLLRQVVPDNTASVNVGRPSGYVFVDERLRATAEASLGEDVLHRVHLEVVRRYVERHGSGQVPNGLAIGKVEATDLAHRLTHLDSEQLGDEDRALVVMVLSAIAQQAMLDGDQHLAHRYLNRALHCCSDQHPERFAMASERARLAGALGLDTAEADVAELLDIAQTPVERARAYRAQAMLALEADRRSDALEGLLAGLAEVGVPAPSAGQELDESFVELIGLLDQFLKDGEVAELATKNSTDDEQILLATELLAAAAQLSRRHRPELQGWIDLTLFDLVRRHGVGPHAAGCVAGTSVVALLELHDRDGALALIDAARALADRFPSPEASAAVLLTSGLYFDHLRHPIEHAVATLDQAWHHGAQADSAHGSAAVALAAMLAAVAGFPLDQQVAQLDEALRTVQDAPTTSRSMGGLGALQAHRISTQALLGQIDATIAVKDLEALLAEVVESGAAGNAAADIDQALVFYALVTLEWWVGRPDNAWKRLEEAREKIPTVRGMAIESNTMLLVVLSGIGVARALRRRRTDDEEVSAERHNELLTVEAKVEAALHRLVRLTEISPDFHGPFHALADAEWGRHLGRPLAESVANYQATIEACGDRYPQLRGLANQRHAELWARDGQKTVARSLFETSLQDFGRWKCQVRINQVLGAHPRLGERADRSSVDVGPDTGTETDFPTAGGLDVESVTKATRAIAAETTSHGLFSALMKVLVEYAGAQSGALVSVEEGNLFVEASIALDAEPHTGRQELSSRSDVAMRAVNFVRRTKSLLVVANATSDARFRNDQHVRSQRVRSLAVVPIELRGELWGVLYLENNALTSAFTPEHVELLRVIAGQAAVSVQQVRVFEELEARVESRTRELADKSRRISALLDHLPQAVLTIGDDRLIEPQFSARASSVLGTDRLAGQDVLDVVFAGTSVDPDTISRCRSALDFSFGLDEFMARLNWPHLIERFTRITPAGQQTFSVDWAPIVDDDDLVQQVLVSVRDITAIEQARAAATAATRDLSIMQQIFGVGFAGAQSFLQEERPRLEAIIGMVDKEPLTVDGAPADAVHSVFRLLHTLKGNARTIGLSELVSAIHHAEEPVAQLADGQVVSRATISEALEEVAICFEAHERLAAQGVGGSVRSSGGSVEDRRVGQIRSVLEADEASARRRLDQISELLDPPTHHTLASLVESAANGMPSLAGELGKPTPIVSVVGPPVVLGDTLVPPLRDALVHIFRNALDHGIEQADERRMVGKPEAGTIVIEVVVEADPDPSGFRCQIYDDGRGLALDRLRTLVADADGLEVGDVADAEAAEMIFRPGLSTNDEVSATSGRGVGMDAVRQFLGEHGGVVDVEFRGPEVGGYRPFAIVIDLPALTAADG